MKTKLILYSALIAAAVCAPATRAQTGKIAYTADGDLYLKYLNNGISAGPTADGAVRQVTATPNLSEFQARLSPDGSRMVCTVSGKNVKSSIRVLDLNGNTVATIRASGGSWATWSADQAFVAYAAANSGIAVRKSDGSGAEFVLTSHGGFPAWSPQLAEVYDGGGAVIGHDTQIAFSSQQGKPRRENIWVVNLRLHADGTVTKLGGEFPLFDPPFSGGDLEWQPDNLIFNHQFAASDVRIVEVADGGIVPLTAPGGTNLEGRWSPLQPDGSRWLAWKQADTATIYIKQVKPALGPEIPLIPGGRMASWGPLTPSEIP
jgi:hypothetical protein